MSTSTLPLPHRRATRRLGRLLAELATAGDLLVLEGDLGAGKTFLVRGIARGLGIPERIPIQSPTFALIHEHKGRLPLVHADLYRLSDPDELTELGLVDRLEDAFVVVEWGARFSEALGNEGLWITIALEAEGRVAQLEARGPRGARLLTEITARAASLSR